MARSAPRLQAPRHGRAGARGRRQCPGDLVRGLRGFARDPRAAVLVAQDRQRAQRASQVRPTGRQEGARRDLERRVQGPRPSRGQRARRRLRHQVAQSGRQDHRRPRCWPSSTTPPSTGAICAPPTRSSPPSPPPGFASESPRALARAPVPRWRSSSSNQHRPGGGPSTHPTSPPWSVPARYSRTASS